MTGPTGAAVVFRPLRNGNAFEETVERLLQAVRLGVVNPGERLPAERDLAERLGVSRVTLREALASLREAGYLESRRGRGGGTFVVARPASSPPGAGTAVRWRDQDAASLDDVLGLRLVLEAGAAELAAGRRPSGGEATGLRAVLDEVERCSPGDYRPADSRLHLAVAQLSGSASLAGLVADARARVNDLLDAIPLLPRNLEHSNAQHARIVAAVLAGEAGEAREAMGEHLEGTAALLRGFLS